ncbi:hypothetical protein FTW19_06095 [Terriglobus albidus]|uniref:Uncharacterized protein n=1 Tax=Terriglobus albidus TaxID=1592106 RepID=A0A5B9E784_9BACT|nr:hypothetical protein [Terriglobus albidus]QEE27609.1 hypothetical protein FTW19_06095 [Terriglobus albidus]
MMKPGIMVVAGALYGLLLAYLALGLAGAGHGIMAYLMLVSAPVCNFVGFIGLLLTPVLWALLAWFATAQRRQWFLGLIFSHYVVGAAAAGFVLRDDLFDPYRKLPRGMYSLFAIGLALYLFGHTLLWLLYTRPRPHSAAIS